MVQHIHMIPGTAAGSCTILLYLVPGATAVVLLLRYHLGFRVHLI